MEGDCYMFLLTSVNPDGLIYSGVCVQRFPILSRIRNGLEQRVHELKVRPSKHAQN